MPISADPGLNFNLGFFISFFKSLKGKVSLFFLEHLMIKLQAKRFELNFLLTLSDLKSNFTLTLAYLNPAFNNLGPHDHITACPLIGQRLRHVLL